MRCFSCGKETAGTATDHGTVSSICPPCNVKATGEGHAEGVALEPGHVEEAGILPATAVPKKPRRIPPV